MSDNNADAPTKADQLFTNLALARHLRSQAAQALPGTRECQECGAPINPDRREALPHTRLCIMCASAEDQKRQHFVRD